VEATTKDRPSPSPVRSSTPVASAPKPTQPVKVWAALGALIVTFETYVIVKWVTGPYFEKVPSGPSEPPTWMQVNLIAWQVLTIPIALGMIYWFVIRPWRRDGRVGIDGLLIIAFATLWWQDVLSAGGQHWFVYNTWLVNFGSWANEIPGWVSFGEPRAMLSEPILFIGGAYVYGCFLGVVVGCYFMRQARRRWPTLSAPVLIAVGFLGTFSFDILLEGIVWLPLGVFEYPGGHWSLFPDHYYKYPLNEGLTYAAYITAAAALRFFVNDRGESIVERGIDKLRGSNVRKTMVRAFAVIAAVQLSMLLLYNIPNGILALNSDPWPADLQKRSYFTNYICGAGTDRACPAPGVPNIRDRSAYPSTHSSEYTVPGGTNFPPPIVPFDEGPPGPQGN
jgi:Spirocyclase AveC-like